MKRFIAAILCMAMAFSFAVPASAVRNVDIVGQMDNSFCLEYYGNPNYTATNIIDLAGIPFENRWGIVFDEYVVNANEIPADTCTRDYDLECTTTPCGSTCINSLASSNHHKNIDRNLNHTDSYHPWLDYDIVLTFTSSNMCRAKNGAHTTGYLGLAQFLGSYAVAKCTDARGLMLNVRVVQHELSHCFGLHDNTETNIICAEGEDCIMNGGYDNNCAFILETIWCSNCEELFDETAH